MRLVVDVLSGIHYRCRLWLVVKVILGGHRFRFGCDGLRFRFDLWLGRGVAVDVGELLVRLLFLIGDEISGLGLGIIRCNRLWLLFLSYLRRCRIRRVGRWRLVGAGSEAGH